MGLPHPTSHDAVMSFEKLRVYQAAELLDDMVTALIPTIKRGYAKDVDQLRRASASVAYNIAEAYGSEGGRKVAHLVIARGSADETRSVLRRLASRGALSKRAIEKPCTLAVTISKMLTSWIDGL